VRVVRVVTELRRQIERDREPGLPALEQVAVPRVRLLGRSKPGVLANRPRAAAIHIRVRAARVRVRARRLERGCGVVGRVDRLDLDPGLGLAAVGRGHGSRLLGMPVKVRLFAGLRERAGWSQREIDAATVGDVWPALELGDEPHGLLYAV